MASRRVNFQHAVFERTAFSSRRRALLQKAHAMGPFRNLTNTKGECALPLEGSKTVSKAPVRRLTCLAAINMSLFKVSRPLTYRSLPLLPPEGLCFPRGPRFGFHHLANKAACISPRQSSLHAVRKHNTLPIRLSNHSYLQSRVFESSLCTEPERLRNFRGKQKKMEDSQFPSLWYFCPCTGAHTQCSSSQIWCQLRAAAPS